MYSHQLPFQELRFTAEIADALADGNLPQFNSEWDVPEGLEELALKCMSIEPSERPEFETIMISLIEIAESFSTMNNIVERVRQKYGHRRALTRNTKAALLTHQLKTINHKIDRLNQREEEALQRLSAVQMELEKIRDTKSDYERNKQSIQSELEASGVDVDPSPRPPSV